MAPFGVKIKLVVVYCGTATSPSHQWGIPTTPICIFMRVFLSCCCFFSFFVLKKREIRTRCDYVNIVCAMRSGGWADTHRHTHTPLMRWAHGHSTARQPILFFLLFLHACSSVKSGPVRIDVSTNTNNSE